MTDEAIMTQDPTTQPSMYCRKCGIFAPVRATVLRKQCLSVKIVVACLAAVCLTTHLDAVVAETIRLVDGSSVVGQVVSDDGSQVTLRHGLTNERIARSRIVQPAASTLKDAQAAFDRKDYAVASDLCRQFLLWEPQQADVASLWRRAHQQQVHDLLERPSPDPFYAEGMRPLLDVVTTDDLPSVHEILNGPTGLNHWPYTILLAWLKSESSVEPLIRALKAWPPGFARMYAAYALGEIGSNKAASTLVTLLMTDPDPAVRRRAAEGLNKLTPPLTTVLRKAAQADKDGGVREEITYLLANPGYKQTSMPSLQSGQVSAGHLGGTGYTVYVPTTYDPRVRTYMLVSIHGSEGSAASAEAVCHADAERYGLIVLAPQFEHGLYPNYGQFNIGIRNLRPDLKLLEIVDHLSKYLNFPKDKLLIVGHSQGGQFVSRFVAAHPDRIWRAAPCAANNYVMPDPALAFPFGMGRTDWTPDLSNMNIDKYLQVPMALVCGTKDEQFRQDAARRFVAAATAYADQHKFHCRATYIPVPDGPHWGVSNWPTARDFLFAELPRK